MQDSEDPKYMHQTDEQRWSALMVSAQGGNESDYRQLLEELATVVHKFLRSRFGPYDFIEDCVQEALIAVHQARHTYNSKRPFRPWLFAIVRNKAIDTLRHRRVRKEAVDHYQREQMTILQAGKLPAPDHEASEGRLLNTLSDQHREVVVLTKIMGFSLAETAERLGISEGAVKLRVHRAVRKLRLLLEREE